MFRDTNTFATPATECASPVEMAEMADALDDALPRPSLGDLIAEFEASVARHVRRQIAVDSRQLAGRLFSDAAARRIYDRPEIIWG